MKALTKLLVEMPPVRQARRAKTNY